MCSCAPGLLLVYVNPNNPRFSFLFPVILTTTARSIHRPPPPLRFRRTHRPRRRMGLPHGYPRLLWRRRRPLSSRNRRRLHIPHPLPQISKPQLRPGNQRHGRNVMGRVPRRAPARQGTAQTGETAAGEVGAVGDDNGMG